MIQMQTGLPWTEKYRPQKLSEITGQTEITKILQSNVKNNTVSNMLFSGSAGIGKTSTAVALAKELFKENFSQNFLELNASDQRGIDVVRGEIKNFARTLAFDTNFKIIFLDESDALTGDAQQALRRTMEKYTKTCRFILSANYSSKLIEPIQSRCVVFRFKKLSAKEVEQKLLEIAQKEKIEIEPKALQAINYVSDGDLRKAINILEATASVNKKISEKDVFVVSSKARPQEIKEIISLGLKGEFLKARDKLDFLMYEYGMSGNDIITQLYKELVNSDETEIDSKTKIELINEIGEYDFRLVEGANERIQIEALIAQFGKYKK